MYVECDRPKRLIDGCRALMSDPIYFPCSSTMAFYKANYHIQVIMAIPALNAQYDLT